MHRFANPRGFALLGVLWTTVLLAVIAGSIASTSRTQLELARNAMETAKAEALADGALYSAIFMLLATEGELPPTLEGSAYQSELGSGEIHIAIEHEGGKVDLNLAESELLEVLFRAAGRDAGTTSVLTDAVVDFRDSDNLRELDPDHRLGGLAHGPKYAPFEAIEELQQVLGITPELYQRIAPFVTVHSWQRGINPLTAPRELIAALPGVPPEDAAAFLAFRSAQRPLLRPTAAVLSDESGPASPILIAAASSRQRSLHTRLQTRRGEAAPATEPREEQMLERFISVERNPIYTIRAAARTAGGSIFAREAVVAVHGSERDPYRIYKWGRGQRPPEFTQAK